MCGEVKRALTRPVPVIDPKSQWNSNMTGNNDPDDAVDADDHDDGGDGGRRDRRKCLKKKTGKLRKCKRGKKCLAPVCPPTSDDIVLTPEKQNKQGLRYEALLG